MWESKIKENRELKEKIRKLEREKWEIECRNEAQTIDNPVDVIKVA